MADVDPKKEESVFVVDGTLKYQYATQKCVTSLSKTYDSGLTVSGIFLFLKLKATFTSTVVTLDLEKNLCTDEMKELVEQRINHFTPRLKSTVSLVKRKKNSKKQKT